MRTEKFALKGGNRTLRLGRYLRLRDIAGTTRVPHNKLLVSLAHAWPRVRPFGKVEGFSIVSLSRFIERALGVTYDSS